MNCVILAKLAEDAYEQDIVMGVDNGYNNTYEMRQSMKRDTRQKTSNYRYYNLPHRRSFYNI